MGGYSLSQLKQMLLLRYLYTLPAANSTHLIKGKLGTN